MANVNLGKVALTPKGNWDNTITYEKLDVVQYDGNSYIAKTGVPVGTSVTTGTEYWQLFSAKGNGISVGDVIIASTTQPTVFENKLWIREGSDEEFDVLTTEDIDDTAGEGDTDKLWSADKNWDEINLIKNLLLDSISLPQEVTISDYTKDTNNINIWCWKYIYKTGYVKSVTYNNISSSEEEVMVLFISAITSKIIYKKTLSSYTVPLGEVEIPINKYIFEDFYIAIKSRHQGYKNSTGDSCIISGSSTTIGTTVSLSWNYHYSFSHKINYSSIISGDTIFNSDIIDNNFIANNLNTCRKTKLYFCNGSLSNQPSDMSTSAACILLNMRFATSTNYNYQILINVDTHKVWSRLYQIDTGTNIKDWHPYVIDESTLSDYIMKYTDDEDATDINNNMSSGSYYINTSSTIDNTPYPVNEGETFGGILTNIPAPFGANNPLYFQMFYAQSPTRYANTIWTRLIAKNKTVYLDWFCMTKTRYLNNIVIFGDSITAGYPQLDSMNYKWWGYLEKNYNISNFAQSGAGLLYKSGSTNGKTFADSLDDTSTNYLCIFMGTNDYGNNMTLGDITDSKTANTVCGALKYIIETTQTNIPGLSIIGILPINRQRLGSQDTPFSPDDNWAYGSQNGAGYTLSELCDKLKTIYESYGIPVIDSRQSPFQRLNLQDLLGDGLHPNLNGYRKLSHFLSGKIGSLIR